MVKSKDLSVFEGYENSFQGVDSISSTPIFSDKNRGFAPPSSIRKESDCMRLGLFSYTPTSVFDGHPSNISVSDDLPRTQKWSVLREVLPITNWQEHFILNYLCVREIPLCL